MCVCVHMHACMCVPLYKNTKTSSVAHVCIAPCPQLQLKQLPQSAAEAYPCVHSHRCHPNSVHHESCESVLTSSPVCLPTGTIETRNVEAASILLQLHIALSIENPWLGLQGLPTDVFESLVAISLQNASRTHANSKFHSYATQALVQLTGSAR